MPTTVLEDLASVLARFTPGAQLSVAAFIVCALWCFFLCIYRLYFHPLAHFPGDRLAAITGWVETYHDVFRGGQFIFTIEKWHAKYGKVKPKMLYQMPHKRELILLRSNRSHKPMGGSCCGSSVRRCIIRW